MYIRCDGKNECAQSARQAGVSGGYRRRAADADLLVRDLRAEGDGADDPCRPAPSDNPPRRPGTTSERAHHEARDAIHNADGDDGDCGTSTWSTGWIHAE